MHLLLIISINSSDIKHTHGQFEGVLLFFSSLLISTIISAIIIILLLFSLFRSNPVKLIQLLIIHIVICATTPGLVVIIDFIDWLGMEEK